MADINFELSLGSAIMLQKKKSLNDERRVFPLRASHVESATSPRTRQYESSWPLTVEGGVGVSTPVTAGISSASVDQERFETRPFYDYEWVLKLRANALLTAGKRFDVHLLPTIGIGSNYFLDETRKGMTIDLNFGPAFQATNPIVGGVAAFRAGLVRGEIGRVAYTLFLKGEALYYFADSTTMIGAQFGIQL